MTGKLNWNLSRGRHGFGQRWWQWFAVTAILFAVGFGALVVLGDGVTATGEDDTGLLNGLAWLAWITTWLGAVISAGLGVRGLFREIAHHGTRSA